MTDPDAWPVEAYDWHRDTAAEDAAIAREEERRAEPPDPDAPAYQRWERHHDH